MEITLKNEDAKNPYESKEEYKKALAQAKEIYRVLKKSLKTKSKSQLIQLIAKYASDLQEVQELNKFLYEENLELKGELNDKQDSNDSE